MDLGQLYIIIRMAEIQSNFSLVKDDGSLAAKI